MTPPTIDMQSLNELSDFFTNRIGASTSDEEALIKPLLRFSSNHSLSAFSSGIDNEYIGPNGDVSYDEGSLQEVRTVTMTMMDVEYLRLI